VLGIAEPLPRQAWEREVGEITEVGDPDELLDAVERRQPDAVMTDIRMPPGHHLEGITGAHTIRERHGDIGVVVLSWPLAYS
jgi:DNA-binding NarL/FixJ family response regulator